MQPTRRQRSSAGIEIYHYWSPAPVTLAMHARTQGHTQHEQHIHVYKQLITQNALTIGHD